MVPETIQRLLLETLSDINNFVFEKVDDLTSLEDIGQDLTTEVKG